MGTHRISLVQLVFAVAALVIGLPAVVTAQIGNSWINTSSMSTGRQAHTATLLTNGQVVVAGGYNNGSYLANAELYDPARGSWTTINPMNCARCLHTATLLPNGKVLAAAGQGYAASFLASAEIYDPPSGTWTT